MSLVRFRNWAFCGCSSMVEHQPSKLDTWVRFPSPALLEHLMKTSDSKMVFARVAQLVEHDLAKVGAAGSSPVSRSHRNTKKVSMWIPFFVFFEPNRGSKIRVTSFASLIGSDPPVSRRKCFQYRVTCAPKG